MLIGMTKTTTFLFIFFHFILADPKYKCFDEEDIVFNLEYGNTGNPVVFDKPLKIHSGGWDNQSALNMILFILFQEKMGIPTEFYPPVENLIMSNQFNVWDDYWNETLGFHPNSNEPYWDDYETWCENEDVHVFASLNTFHEVPSIISDENGVVEQLGWFIPKRMAEGIEQRGADYKNLLTDVALRKETKEVGQTKSTVWGSNDDYYVSKISNQILDYHNLEDHWQINFTGTDVAEFNKISELENLKDDFVFISWQPSVHATIGDFIPINWPYNPSGLRDDPCEAKGECGFSPDSLRAGYCSQFANEDPDELDSAAPGNNDLHFLVTEFFSNFRVTRPEVDNMMREFGQDPQRNLFQSVCGWLKTEEGRTKTEEWVKFSPDDLQEPTRREFSEGKRIVVLFVSIVIQLVGGLTLFAIYYFREEPKMKRLGPVLTGIWVAALMVADLIPAIIVYPYTKAKCVSFFSTYVVSMSFSIAVPTLRAARMYRIFNGEVDVDVSDWWMYKWLAVIAFIDMALIFFWSGFFLNTGLDTTYDQVGETWYYEHDCRPPGPVTGVTTLAWFYNLLLVTGLLCVAYKTKIVFMEELSESKWLAFVACCFGMFTIVLGLNSYKSDLTQLAWRTLVICYVHINVLVLGGSSLVSTFWRDIRERPSTTAETPVLICNVERSKHWNQLSPDQRRTFIKRQSTRRNLLSSVLNLEDDTEESVCSRCREELKLEVHPEYLVKEILSHEEMGGGDLLSDDADSEVIVSPISDAENDTGLFAWVPKGKRPTGRAPPIPNQQLGPLSVNSAKRVSRRGPPLPVRYPPGDVLIVKATFDASQNGEVVIFEENSMYQVVKFGQSLLTVSPVSDPATQFTMTQQYFPYFARFDKPALKSKNFNVGDLVDMRDGDNERWRQGIVTSIKPLKVQPKGGYNKDFEWNQVRFRPDEDQTEKAVPLLNSTEFLPGSMWKIAQECHGENGNVVQVDSKRGNLITVHLVDDPDRVIPPIHGKYLTPFSANEKRL